MRSWLVTFSRSLYFCATLLWLGESFAANDVKTIGELLAQPSRPTMTQIKALVDQGMVPPDFMAYPVDADLMMNIGIHAPSIIAQFEKLYPGMNYAALGRDTALLGDILDAFYISIGQPDRVYRLNASGQSLTGDRNLLIDFIKSQTNFSHQKIGEYPGLIIFDSTRWHSSSQGRQYINAIYETCLARRDCRIDLLLEKLQFLNVGYRQGSMYKRNLVTPDFNLIHFFQQRALELVYGQRPSQIVSVDVDPSLIYTKEYHKEFSQFARANDGTVFTVPGDSAPTEDKKQIIRNQIGLYELINGPNFFHHVAGQAQKYEYTFPKTRIVDLNERWQIRAKINAPPYLENARAEFNEENQKTKVIRQSQAAFVGVLLLIGAIGGSGFYQNYVQIEREKVWADLQINESNDLFWKKQELASAKSFAQFNHILEPIVKNPSSIYYYGQIQEFWKRYLDLILASKPTVKEIAAISFKFDDIDIIEKLFHARLKSVPQSSLTLRDFLDAIDQFKGSAPQKAFSEVIEDELTPSRMEQFFHIYSVSDDVQVKEVRQLLSVLTSDNKKLKVLKEVIQNLDTRVILQIINPKNLNLEADVLENIETLWKQNLDTVLKRTTSTTLLNELLKEEFPEKYIFVLLEHEIKSASNVGTLNDLFEGPCHGSKSCRAAFINAVKVDDMKQMIRIVANQNEWTSATKLLQQLDPHGEESLVTDFIDRSNKLGLRKFSFRSVNEDEKKSLVEAAPSKDSRQKALQTLKPTSALSSQPMKPSGSQLLRPTKACVRLLGAHTREL